MACKSVCQLCPRLIISQAVTFAGGVLTINLPEGSYASGNKFCIVVAQAIPAAATITAPVVITVGDSAVEYSLTDRCCAQLTACAIRTRTRYSVLAVTSPTGGNFKLLGRASCAPNYNLAAIDGTAPAAPEGGGAG